LNFGKHGWILESFAIQPAESRREQEYRSDQEKLKDENLHLRQRVAFELERCKELERDLTQLEREMEIEEEKYAARLLRLPLALFLILLPLIRDRWQYHNDFFGRESLY
jgi:hypothetical protein